MKTQIPTCVCFALRNKVPHIEIEKVLVHSAIPAGSLTGAQPEPRDLQTWT